ncbi:MOSC domain-containing protein [Paenibacillus sp. R14(2021)]|uniref:MOSC domain-containing protein n=1 Tax=Paenibacillus sp. R14(2021) TaxID=2859228 RepID=UPI001C611561|nr:MOSC domain-containing protein [Paenibacillus sp. R14(2021)]
MELGELVSLNISLLETVPFGEKEVITGINKKAVVGKSLPLSFTGLAGDAQGDLVNHGGPDKAVCVYSADHFPYWQQKWKRPVAAGAFGENFTVTGLTEESLCIGDQVSVGQALLQVSQPRQPCYKLGMKHGLPSLQLDVQQNGYTGFYFRVLAEGEIAQGDKLILQQRHPAGISIVEANRVMHKDKRDREGMLKLLSVPELSSSWQHSFMKRLARLNQTEN